MAPQNATFFVDDQHPDVQYLCKVIKQQVVSAYYNNSWTQADDANCDKGWFKYTFQGTRATVQAAFFKSSNFSVKLDDGAFVSQTGNGSWTSPLLENGQHTITYAMGNLKAYPALDYIAVSAGPDTSLQDKTVIVDNEDTSISFSGSWSRASPVQAFFDYQSTMYQNSSLWATKAGDSLTFDFEGSSISLYGMAAYNTTSMQNITADYTIDGVTKTWTLPNATYTSFNPMLEIIHADVGPGNHSLAFNITSITGERSLAIDFVAYNASYQTLHPSSTQALNSSIDWRAKVGISIGAIAGFALILILGLFFWRKMSLGRHQGKKYVNHS